MDACLTMLDCRYREGPILAAVMLVVAMMRLPLLMRLSLEHSTLDSSSPCRLEAQSFPPTRVGDSHFYPVYRIHYHPLVRSKEQIRHHLVNGIGVHVLMLSEKSPVIGSTTCNNSNSNNNWRRLRNLPKWWKRRQFVIARGPMSFEARWSRRVHFEVHHTMVLDDGFQVVALDDDADADDDAIGVMEDDMMMILG
mmetsp:Transcript_19627/g.42770  ORF Transcript_19627/g.42770 Transcript_19627/m.42770 type:complete len:195 (-) Transcript_19627:547-1131(-)